MKSVVDANIILSVLIKPGRQLDLFFREELELSTPALLLEELERNLPTIKQKSQLSDDDLTGLISILKNRIAFISEKEFIEHLTKAESICPDPKDVPYFALAMHLDCAIWTNEKCLEQQSAIQILRTNDMIRLFAL